MTFYKGFTTNIDYSGSKRLKVSTGLDKLFKKKGSIRPKRGEDPAWTSSLSLNMKKMMKVMGKTALEGKKQRLAEGISGSGKPIREYSDRYKKKKSSIGKAGKRYSLQYSGVLVASLKAEKARINLRNGLASTVVSIPASQRWKKNVLGAKGYYISGVTLKTRKQVERAVHAIGNKLLSQSGKADII